MKLTVLFGTETGNSQNLAEKVAAKAVAQGWEAQVIDLAAYSVEQLAALDHPTLIVISTWDDGDPPSKCVPFYEALMAQGPDLSRLAYTVLALGDEDYALFCECGKRIDARLGELGARCFLPRTDLGADFLATFGGWSKRFWAAVQQLAAV